MGLEMRISKLVDKIEDAQKDRSQRSDLLYYISSNDLISYAQSIQEELNHDDESRRHVISQARQLNDNILEPYLDLGEEDRRNIARVFTTEEDFRVIRKIPEVKKRENKFLSSEVLTLTQNIALLPFVTEILENYILRLSNVSFVRNGSLIRYLRNYDIKDNQVREDSKNSMSFLVEDKNEDKLLKSFSYGLSSQLITNVNSVMLMIPQRERVLNQILLNFDKKKIQLSNYLQQHNLSGEKVKKLSSNSLVSWTKYDFEKRKLIRIRGLNETIFYGLNQNLISKVKSVLI